MTVKEVLNGSLNEALSGDNVYGSLDGGNLNPVKRHGDLQNRISIGSAGAYLAKRVFKEHAPYSVMITPFEMFDPVVNTIFRDAVLNHLLYNVPLQQSGFDRAGELFWEEFKEQQLGVTKTGELLVAIITLNDWLVIETVNGIHSETRPSYTTTWRSSYMNYHFLSELRRLLSGEAEEGSSSFSPEEEIFYLEYQEYSEGIEKSGDLLIALLELDNWITREVANDFHHILERDYETTHKWRKTQTSD